MKTYIYLTLLLLLVACTDATKTELGRKCGLEIKTSKLTERYYITLDKIMPIEYVTEGEQTHVYVYVGVQDIQSGAVKKLTARCIYDTGTQIFIDANTCPKGETPKQCAGK